MTSGTEHSEIVVADGHLVDSQLLNLIFDKVIERGGHFDVLEFRLGRNNDEFSHLKLKVTADSSQALRHLLEELMPLGCHSTPDCDASLTPAEANGVVTDEFYSTTNHQTEVRYGGTWLKVQHQRMDAVIAIEAGRPVCRKLRDVKQGQLIVSGVDGIRVSPEFQERDRLGFAFMTNDVSTERRVEVSAGKVVALMRKIKAEGGRIGFVAGPVVVHSGGAGYFSDLIRRGYVSVLLSGNALAVHDVERALFGTSLGVDLEHGVTVEEGHQNHMRAINMVRRAGGLRQAVAQGALQTGIMHDLIVHNVPYVLAGSIRDDGPLPDTLMDLVEAQNRYAAELENVSMVVMLSTMLHSIGVGNMLPSHVRVVCVDINPAVVTKLSDRGSSQTVGIVTDVGLFLHQLSTQLARSDAADPATGVPLGITTPDQ